MMGLIGMRHSFVLGHLHPVMTAASPSMLILVSYKSNTLTSFLVKSVA
jgi:hypothetical protein